MNRILLAVAALTAVVVFGLSPAHAAYIGNAPWCAVVNVGAGSIEWDCEYPSAAACAPNVVAGNRGFCAINPYYAPHPPYGASHANRVRRHPYGY